MPRNTLDEICERLAANASLDQKTKKELLELLESLKKEIETLPQSVSDDARSITGFANISAHEATRTDKKPESLELAINGLEASVKGFEASHPKLVGIVNRISMMLSDMGI